MSDFKQCAWCGAKTKEECKAGENCMQGKQHPGWGCMDHIHPTTDAVINVLSHVTGQPKLAIANRELEIAAEQVCGLEDQLAALREELATQDRVLRASVPEPQAMELVALKATVAQQAQLIEWLQKGSPKQEPVAYMRNEGTPNNLVKCTFTCPGAFGVYRQLAPVAVVLAEYKVEDRDDNFPEGWNACLDKVKELNQ